MDHTSSHSNHSDHESMKGKKDHQDHSMHHQHMIADFKKRFWVSLVITLPIIVMAPMIQELLGYEFTFTGDRYFQFGLATLVFFYGGWPFLTGLADEIKKKAPGMMTLIALS